MNSVKDDEGYVDVLNELAEVDMDAEIDLDKRRKSKRNKRKGKKNKKKGNKKNKKKGKKNKKNKKKGKKGNGKLMKSIQGITEGVKETISLLNKM